MLEQEEHSTTHGPHSRQGTGCACDILQLYDTARKEDFSDRVSARDTYKRGTTCSIQNSLSGQTVPAPRGPATPVYRHGSELRAPNARNEFGKFIETVAADTQTSSSGHSGGTVGQTGRATMTLALSLELL